MSALIVGAGSSAAVAARALAAMGVKATFARLRDGKSQACFAHPAVSVEKARELPSHVHDLSGVEVLDLDRAPDIRREYGRFVVSWGDDAPKSYDCVLLSPEISLRAAPSAMPQDAELFSAEADIGHAAKMAFVLDYDGPSDPALGMCAIKAAAANVGLGGESVVCLRHAPVRHLFGEALYNEARRIGVSFVRFGETPPAFLCDAQGPARFRIVVEDVIDKDHEYVFDCDRLFAVTGPDPVTVAPWASETASPYDVDHRGFLLSDNVRCVSGRAFSSGLFIIGEAAGNLDLLDAIAQAEAAATNAYTWMRTSQGTQPPVSVSSSCVGCLTCYRVCPHRAVTINPGKSPASVTVQAAWCRRCGLCATVCPAAAITAMFSGDESLLAAIEETPRRNLNRTAFVFGCRRSAGVAARRVQLPEDVRFIEVPCAGRVSERVIWRTLAAGAAGVLVVGCHEGNCASDRGTDFALRRVLRGRAVGVFQQGPPALAYATIAANEPARLEKMVREFATSCCDRS
jgi:coenzyme F420-reducing hydrogenase delta subunit/Pyruvate/2-oxoacid:ferredoxin oxidoreductase delta subunit